MAKWNEYEVFSNKEIKAGIDRWQSARCSNCETYLTTPYMYYFHHYNYCPNCGMKMEKGE